MKMKFLAALAVSSMFAFTACSDDESESLADKCSGGLNEDCLEGTWNLDAIALKSDPNTVLVSFKSNPSKLTFNSDGTFSYTFSSSLTGSECAGVTNYGKWDVLNETQLQLKATNGDCFKSNTLSPTFTVESSDAGDKVLMNIQTVFFQQSESDGVNVGSDTEIFGRIE